MSESSKFVRIADMQREAGWGTDLFKWIGRRIQGDPEMSERIIQDVAKRNPQLPRSVDMSDFGKSVMEGLNADSRGRPLVDVVGRGFNDYTQDTALKMMGKLPGKLEPALNSGLLGKFFPNLRLDIGCLKTPVEGLSIVDASGNVLRDSKMTMGDLLKLADKDPASLKSTLKVTDSAKYLNSLDTFSDVALRRQADARNYNILRNVVRGTKVFALLAGLAGTAYLIHQFGPDTPGTGSGPHAKDIQNAADQAGNDLAIPSTDDNTKIFTPKSDLGGYGQGFGRLGPGANPQPGPNPLLPPGSDTGYDWQNQDDTLRPRSSAVPSRVAFDMSGTDQSQSKPMQLPPPPTLPDEQTILNFTMQIGGTPEGLERVTAQLQSVAQEAAHYFKQLHALVPDLKLPELQEGP